MRRYLTSYLSGPGQETIVPWALVECEQPSKMDPDERHRLFGDASLG